VVTVGVDGAGVERRLAAGGLACPLCSGRLTGWGYARHRVLRGPDGPLWTHPRRSRCTGCGVTHVLLPVVALLRRADAAVVIGAAVAARAAGMGHRRIAGLVGRPESTVRGWLRRFGGRVEAVRVVFTGWVRALAPDPVLPDPAGGVWADTVAAIGAAAVAVAGRFVIEVSPWLVAVAVSSGLLLAPGWPLAASGCGSTRVAPDAAAILL
jgi:Homeodomain-like domain